MPQPHPAFLHRESQASTGPEGGKQADKRMESLVERKGSGDALSQTPERILYRCSFAHNVPEMRQTLPVRNRVQQRAHLMLSANVKADAQRTAKDVANQLQAYFVQQGWITPQ